jgi:hypothetical protein
MVAASLARLPARLDRSTWFDVGVATFIAAVGVGDVCGGNFHPASLWLLGALLTAGATIKTRVARILMKLQVRDRVQAVVYAYEHGVVRPGGEEPR